MFHFLSVEMAMVRKFIIRSFSVFALITLVVSSCKKDKESVYDHFVSDEYAVTYSQPTMEYMIDIAAQSYSQISSLKSYITSDVVVYKIVYKTTVEGENIRASGLVCVPATSGKYPVLSFQNGTNTLNEYAPSNYFAYPYYQLIEFIASMGFVVVIPDYPGFGSSSQIPHPYLIKDPTVQSILDMLRAIMEGAGSEIPGISLKNEYYLMGYSQGGWATLCLHKAMELDNPEEFNLAGSVCGAGPYNMYNLFLSIVNSSAYPMPSYLGYIINAYIYYNQFSCKVSDILNEPYSSRLSLLYKGTMGLDQINDSLNTSIPALFKSDFLSGYATSQSYSSVRQALVSNSITAWHSYKPLFFGHGQVDTDVSVSTTETMYDEMINAGTSTIDCKKVLYPDLNHGSALLPCITDGLLFLLDIKNRQDN